MEPRNGKLDFSDFKEKILESVKKTRGKDTVSLCEIHANNGVIFTGIAFEEELLGEFIPNIFLEYYYDLYLKDNAGEALDNVMDVICQEIQTTVWELLLLNLENKSNDIGGYKDYEAVRERIAFKLINTERNRRLLLLEQAPSIPFLDLSIVFYVKPYCRPGALVTEVITSEQAKLWQVDAKELYRQAQKNMPVLFPAYISTINEARSKLHAMLGEDAPGKISGSSLLFLSNEKAIDGAAVMLYEGVLEKLSSSYQQNMIIMPICTAAVIALPDDGNESYQTLRNGLNHIFSATVPEDIYLSSQIYLYRRETGKFEIA